jgi:hypothetical protein
VTDGSELTLWVPVTVMFGFLRLNWAENTKILRSAFAELPYMAIF